MFDSVAEAATQKERQRNRHVLSDIVLHFMNQLSCHGGDGFEGSGSDILPHSFSSGIPHPILYVEDLGHEEKSDEGHRNRGADKHPLVASELKPRPSAG